MITFDDLARHVGHQVEVSAYGDHVVVECYDCRETLVLASREPERQDIETALRRSGVAPDDAAIDEAMKGYAQSRADSAAGAFAYTLKLVTQYWPEWVIRRSPYALGYLRAADWWQKGPVWNLSAEAQWQN